jgi:hypothetical protein
MMQRTPIAAALLALAAINTAPAAEQTVAWGAWG